MTWMTLRRRHLLTFAFCAATALGTMGADCLGDDTPDKRAECEAVCDAEAQCFDAAQGVGRSKDDCLAKLCSDTGFNTVADGDNTVDFATLAANDCEKAAADCGALLKCSCPDSCSRTDDCTGEQSGTCVDDCDNLIEQDPSLYLENRCKMESTCADLAACGGTSG